MPEPPGDLAPAGSPSNGAASEEFTELRRLLIGQDLDRLADIDARLDDWRKSFSDFEIQPTLVLARQTWHPVKPARVVYAFVPPRP